MLISPKRHITVGDSESFAVEDLISQAERVTNLIISENELNKDEVESLRDLKRNVISNAPLDKLLTGNDIDAWHKLLEMHESHTWLNDFHHGLRISYFHRLIIDKLNYFETLKDPYKKLKQDAFKSLVDTLATELIDSLDISKILECMLWGNKFDLILTEIRSEKQLLVDQRDEVIKFLIKNKPERIDIIADNAGPELFYDLVFAIYVLEHRLSNEVIFHVKNYPYNVSDATLSDFKWMISEINLTPKLQKMGSKLDKFILGKKLSAISYPFTTLGLNRSDAINIVEERYNSSNLLITKGDFNYRKNVGWLYWKISDDYATAMQYLKTSHVCFRVIKNEVLMGIQSVNSLDSVTNYDEFWWKKGIGGMILFNQVKVGDVSGYKTIDNYWTNKV